MKSVGLVKRPAISGSNWILREGLVGLTDQSKAPKNPKRTYSEDQKQLILELKSKKPTYGPKNSYQY